MHYQVIDQVQLYCFTCFFFFLQNIGHWLHDSRYVIYKTIYIKLSTFKAILCYSSLNQFEKRFDALLSSDVVQKYPNLVLHLENIYQNKES